MVWLLTRTMKKYFFLFALFSFSLLDGSAHTKIHDQDWQTLMKIYHRPCYEKFIATKNLTEKLKIVQEIVRFSPYLQACRETAVCTDILDMLDSSQSDHSCVLEEDPKNDTQKDDQQSIQ